MTDLDSHLRKFQKELSAGTVSLALLAVLGTAGEPMYGYQIAKRLEQRGRGRAQRQAERAVSRAAQPARAAGCSTASSSPRSPARRAATTALPKPGARPCATGPPPGAPPVIPSTPSCGEAMNASNRRTHVLPTTIPDYLEQLRRSLAGADPALVQDALYDAEEYLRSELAENPRQVRSRSDRLRRRQLRRAGRSRRHLPRHRGEGADRAAHAAARPPPPTVPGSRPVLRRDRRAAHLCRAVLHAAVAGDRHLLLHLGGDRRVAVGGPGGADHRHSVRDPVLRLGARAVAGRRAHRRGDARRTHAAPAAVHRRAASRCWSGSRSCSPIRAPGPRSCTSC